LPSNSSIIVIYIQLIKEINSKNKKKTRNKTPTQKRQSRVLPFFFFFLA